MLKPLFAISFFSIKEIEIIQATHFYLKLNHAHINTTSNNSFINATMTNTNRNIGNGSFHNDIINSKNKKASIIDTKNGNFYIILYIYR
jgi:hypothetical protein